jgi:D-alanyl-D-alanine carboxypeptidase
MKRVAIVLLGFSILVALASCNLVKPGSPSLGPGETATPYLEKQDSSKNVIMPPKLTAEQQDKLNLVALDVDDIDDTGYLILVNPQYSIDVEFNDSKFAQVLDFVPTSPVGVRDMYLESSALTAVAEMFAAAREAGIKSDEGGASSVSSGFRGYDKQKELYEWGSQSGYISPPGHSEHHTGLAVDIAIQGVEGAEFGNTPRGIWFADNSYRFGLILRYPKGAESITGINYEPWHFRYVGEVHAHIMQQCKLVFEEYIQLIQEQGSLYFEKDGINYYIFHQAPQNGAISVPDGLDYIISNDNSGGYIVTAF